MFESSLQLLFIYLSLEYRYLFFSFSDLPPLLYFSPISSLSHIFKLLSFSLDLYSSSMSSLAAFFLANGAKAQSKNFVFKCHRDGSNVHSVNSIDFHHYGTFCTAGSDGTFCWWDKEARYVILKYISIAMMTSTCLPVFCNFYDMRTYTLLYLSLDLVRS